MTIRTNNGLIIQNHDLFRTGFRHGTDGIKFYPPIEWGCEPVGDLETAGKHYAAGYKSGRKQFRQQVGRFPKSGATQFDNEILIDIKGSLNNSDQYGADE